MCVHLLGFFEGFGLQSCRLKSRACNPLVSILRPGSLGRGCSILGAPVVHFAFCPLLFWAASLQLKLVKQIPVYCGDTEVLGIEGESHVNAG